MSSTNQQCDLSTNGAVAKDLLRSRNVVKVFLKARDRSKNIEDTITPHNQP